MVMQTFPAPWFLQEFWNESQITNCQSDVGVFWTTVYPRFVQRDTWPRLFLCKLTASPANAISDAGAEALAKLLCADSEAEGKLGNRSSTLSSGAARLKTLDIGQVSALYQTSARHASMLGIRLRAIYWRNSPSSISRASIVIPLIPTEPVDRCGRNRSGYGATEEPHSAALDVVVQLHRRKRGAGLALGRHGRGRRSLLQASQNSNWGQPVQSRVSGNTGGGKTAPLDCSSFVIFYLVDTCSKDAYRP